MGPAWAVESYLILVIFMTFLVNLEIEIPYVIKNVLVQPQDGYIERLYTFSRKFFGRQIFFEFGSQIFAFKSETKSSKYSRLQVLHGVLS